MSDSQPSSPRPTVSTDSEPAADVAQALASRRSIRAFLPTPVPHATLDRILALAARAPSGTNTQPWQVIVLQGEALQTIVAELVARHEAGDEGSREYDYYSPVWREPYLGRRRENGWSLYGLLGIGKGDREATKRLHRRNFCFFDAPVGLIFTIDRDLARGSWLDFGMFMQSVMLAARGFGLHTCPQAAFAQYHAYLQQRLAIPAERMVVAGMALGHADPDAVVNRLVTPRVPVDGFTRWVDRLPQ